MNQASKIVSDALLGMDFKNVEIGGVVYTIKPPTIKVICRAIHHFSNVGMEGDNIVEAIKELPEVTEDMLKGVSCFICGSEDTWLRLWKTGLLTKLRMAWKPVSP